MHIIVAVNADAACVGAKWALIKWSNERTNVLRSMVNTMLSGGNWKYVDEMVLSAGFCEITMVNSWPYKMLPPIDQYFISVEEPEYAVSDAAFDRSVIRTEYERVSVTTFGQVSWLSDFKHSAPNEGIISTYLLDIDDIKVG